MALVPAVSWPWVPAWGSLEPPRRDGENAQKTGKNGEKMVEIRSKKCEQGRERRDHLGRRLAGGQRVLGGLLAVHKYVEFNRIKSVGQEWVAKSAGRG